MEDLMIKIDNVSKKYKLGQIGGTTLRDELKRKWARMCHKEDPTKKIGAKDYEKGDTFMALNGVSFEVKKGERVGIIGHNGAGKSTLLKLISRVTAPTGGEIGLNGRITSMLEVGTGFHPELTGRENVYMNGAILGMTRKEIDERIEDIIEFSEVRQFIDTPVKRYSSGMYVKLAFSVAAHLNSEIMIMDEVLAVGDMAFQKKCLDKMNDVSKKEGRTILYVSHNMNTIRQLCERVIVLDHGIIIYDGDVEEAISIYMSDAVSELDVDIDLSNKRMEHLSNSIRGKITHLTLLEKEKAQYDFGEIIKARIDILSVDKLTDLCLRTEIRAKNGTPVGLTKINNFSSQEPNTSKNYDLSFDFSGLVTGKYNVCLVLYEVNEFGSFVDVDAIYPAFVFEIVDKKNAIGLNWVHTNWGYVSFDDTKLIVEND